MRNRIERDRIDQLLGKASRLISRAELSNDRTNGQGKRRTWLLAAETEEEAACLLEMAGDDKQAAVHRISAASCYQQAEEHFRAITLLRAALAGDFPSLYRERVTKQLKRCRLEARKQLEEVVPN